MTTSTKHKFHVVGMHCQSCVILTEGELKNHPEVRDVKASLATCTVEVEGEFGDKEREHLVHELTEFLKPHGYALALDKPLMESRAHEFKLAIPLAAAVILLFFVLQKLGIVNWVNATSISYGTAFLIGVVASLSTCMAVVGGLLLSMSATFAKDKAGAKPQIMFHAGRIISFFFLGGLIGLVGSAFTLSSLATFILGIIIGLVMLFMGLNLLETFSWTKKLLPRMPSFLSKKALSAKNMNHTLTPMLVGIVTFFLPCGFTQAMQIYTLSTGGFLPGALTMFAFALGTLPVLALMSMGSMKFEKSEKRGVFFKTAGLVVIAFAVFNIMNSLAVVGIIPPLLNF